MTSISSALSDSYKYLNQSTIGLCFLPVGLSICLSGVYMGRVVDREFRRAGGTRGAKISVEFDLEKVRSLVRLRMRRTPAEKLDRRG